MGKRSRARGRTPKLRAAEASYRDSDGNELVLRGSMSPLTRMRYESIRTDQSKITEDSWHRSVEFLFERLAVRWVIADVPTEGQKELLSRFRIASSEERRFVREALRDHIAGHFPGLVAP